MSRLEAVGVVYGALCACGASPSRELLMQVRGMVHSAADAMAVLEVIRESSGSRVAAALGALRARHSEGDLSAKLALSVGLAKAQRGAER